MISSIDRYDDDQQLWTRWALLVKTSTEGHLTTVISTISLIVTLDILHIPAMRHQQHLIPRVLGLAFCRLLFGRRLGQRPLYAAPILFLGLLLSWANDVVHLVVGGLDGLDWLLNG